jgi:hypothetical protein
MAAPVSTASGAAITTPAYEFDSLSLASDTLLSLGFWFRTNQQVVITHFGYFDEGCDGLETPHDVGVFDGSGALLAMTTINAGEAHPLDGHFRYRSIAPLELRPNTWYVIVATTGGPADQWGYGRSNDIHGLSVSPLISVPPLAGVFVYQSDDTLAFPTQQFGYQLYAGPNMLLAEAVTVPEPGSVALILAGAIAIALARPVKMKDSRGPSDENDRVRFVGNNG